MQRSLGITIEELLNLEVMKSAKILAGKDGVGRKILSVNVMEVPDIIDWVKTGEFLLTTAYSIKDHIEILLNLIPQLNDKGLAGLGIKMKRYVDRLPDEIIKAANDLSFPIIEIPFDAAYTEIMMPVLTEIIDRQTNTLKKVDEIHTKLMNVMLKGGSIKEIADTIALTIGNSVAITDVIFDTTVICCQEEKLDDIKKVLAEEREHSYERGYSHSRQKTLTTRVDHLWEDCIHRIQVPIYIEGRHYGYLYVWEDHKKMSAIELTSIEAAVPMIALDLVKKASIFEIESRHKIEFFDDLLSKDEKRHRKAMERASFFDFDSRIGYAVMVISLKSIKELVKETVNNSSFLYQLNSKVLQIIERVSRNRKDKIIFGNKSDQIIILYGAERTKTAQMIKAELESYARQIIDQIEKEIKDIPWVVGMGRFYKELDKLWRSYNEASKASKNSSGYKGCEMIHFDELGIYRLLCYEEMQDELNQFYQETLAPLVSYDKEKDSELVKTLYMYFQCGGNLKKISEEMFTHYNTIIYRMQRIKEITGIDLDDPGERLNVQVSLKILELKKKEEI
ncbi:MAG: PucR family transcriptional regulator [Bacillota bacterium]